MNGVEARKVLENLQKAFFETCNTVHVKVLFRNVILTMEPENLQDDTVFKLQRLSYKARRKHALGPYVGQGIFTSDDLIWKYSHELLRPNFARTQIDNPATLEPHMSTLLGTVPRDGSTFDLQELFFRFTTDTAIDFYLDSMWPCPENTSLYSPRLSTTLTGR